MLIWRRAIGVAIMTLGASAVAATATGASLVGVSLANGGQTQAPIGAMAGFGSTGLLGGFAILLLGRWAYGEWRRAAPIANFTADVASMIGFAIALALGGMFLFLVATGLKPEDGAAAATLALGAVGGLGLAFLGWNLRSGDRGFPD